MANQPEDRGHAVAPPSSEVGEAIGLSWRTPDLSVLTLIGANLLPLAGALFFGWDAGVILVVYWSENLVVGFYNILKMALACGKSGAGHAAKLFLIPFFLIHFGGFCAIHGLFVHVFASGMDANRGSGNFFPEPEHWPGPLMFVGLLVGVIQAMWAEYGQHIFIPVVGMFVSHGVSFFQNFLWRGEYRTSRPEVQMALPYGRIVLMHVAIIAAGLPVILLGSPLPLLVILIGLKTAIDVALHLASHREMKGGVINGLASMLRRRKG